jgi:hypothetical protein
MKATNGGAYYSSESDLSVSDSKHEYYAHGFSSPIVNGGIFYISDPVSIQVNSCTFSDISGVTNGGIYYISDSSYSNIKFSTMVYQNIYDFVNGGVLYGSGVDVELYHSTFYNIHNSNSDTGNGGIFYLASTSSFRLFLATLKKCTIDKINNLANGGIAYLTNHGILI